MSEWRAQLNGREEDLRELENNLSDHDPTLFCENDKFYLKSTVWNQFEDAQEVHSRVKAFVQRLVQAAHLWLENTGSLTINHIERLDDNEKIQGFVLLEDLVVAHSSFRAYITSIEPDGQPIESGGENTIVKTLLLSEQNSALEMALKFFRRGDWGSLYKAYEILREAVSDDSESTRSDWLKGRSIKRFTQTAQSFAAIGDEARHATRHYKAPQKPMSISEAKEVIADVLKKWIGSM